MTRTCAVCETKFEAKTKRHTYCGAKCRQRKHRGATPPEVVGDDSSLVAAVQAELEAAKALASVDGQLALRIARKIEKSADTGSGVAALVRELKALLADATGAPRGGGAGGRPPDDEVDELRARRDAKLAAG